MKDSISSRITNLLSLDNWDLYKFFFKFLISSIFTFLKFDPSVGKLPPIFGLGIIDFLTGGNQRREDKFNDAIKFMQDNAYGQTVGNDLFQVFTPQQYYRNVLVWQNKFWLYKISNKPKWKRSYKNNEIKLKKK